MEMEKRTVATQPSSIYAEQTDIMEALSSEDSDWDDHLDQLADAGMNLVMQLVTVEVQDTRPGKRIQPLDEFDDDTAEVSTESQGMVVSRRHLCNARGLPKRKYS